MLEYISIFQNFLLNINPLLILVIIYLIGLYIFWRGTIESRKNRSSVFDMFFLGGFFSVLVGRIAYIVVEWSDFAQYIWYWLPYEKYGSKIYLFRLLPWRFLNIWDGQLIIFAMFVGLLLFCTFYSLVIKRWRWKHMLFPIFFSATTMLGFSFIFTGLVDNVGDWVFKGLVLIGVLIVFFALFNFISKLKGSFSGKRLMIGYSGVSLMLIESIFIGYIYLTSNLSFFENIFVYIFLIWSLIFGIIFVLDLRKPSVSIEKFSGMRSIGQPSIRA